MEHVVGVLSVTFNGQALVLASGDAAGHEILLPGLAERNVLVLEIDTSTLSAQPDGADQEWGMIALAVRTVEPEEDPARLVPRHP
jgi:hypothetical protein